MMKAQEVRTLNSAFIMHPTSSGFRSRRRKFMDPHVNYSSSSSSSTLSDEEDDITDEQLQTLQSMIPNTMGADKRSILQETHEYLKKIQEESERIEKELSQGSSSNGRPSSSSSEGRQHGPKILNVEVEELMPGGKSFVVKMSWRKGGNGSGTGHVQRVINECCSDVTMTSTIVDDNNPNLMHTTAFVKVSEEMKTTEEELHALLINTTSRFGLLP